jgi:anaerobic C4-dicarboxylate transporter
VLIINEENNSKGRKMHVLNKVGVGIFLAGLVIMIAYSVYPLYNTAVEELTMLFGMQVSMALMGIGAAILLVTMSFERYKEWKKMKEEISEEDLRP